jgi:hypothetical protein
MDHERDWWADVVFIYFVARLRNLISQQTPNFYLKKDLGILPNPSKISLERLKESVDFSLERSGLLWMFWRLPCVYNFQI